MMMILIGFFLLISVALNIFENLSSTPVVKKRFSSGSMDSKNPQLRYSGGSNNRSVSVDVRNHGENNGAQRNSFILQQNSNRSSMDHPQSNRSSLDVSQSSYNTLIIHDNNETQPLFSAASSPAGLIKHELYFINSSPSPPNYGTKKDKSTSRSFGNYSGQAQGSEGNMRSPITENEQQYLNQSYVLKHLAKVKMANTQKKNDSTHDSGVSENHQPWSSDIVVGIKSKSKSQPDLTKLAGSSNDSQDMENNSTIKSLNFNELEQLELENSKLRGQLNDCLMKVAKSQKVILIKKNLFSPSYFNYILVIFCSSSKKLLTSIEYMKSLFNLVRDAKD